MAARLGWAPDERSRWPACRALLAPEVAARCGEGLAVRALRGLPREDARAVAAAITKTVRWRLDHDVDAMLVERVELWEPYHDIWRTTSHGRDDRGRLIFVERCVDLDTDRLHREIPKRCITRNRAQDMEILDALQARASAAVDRPSQTEHVHVFDLGGLTRGKLTRQTIATVVDIVGLSLAHYPGSLGAMYLTNAPFAFQILWRIIRPTLARETIAKILILGGPDDYLPKLVERGCPLDALPTWMVSEKHGMRGKHAGVPTVAYVNALNVAGDPLCLERTNSLQCVRLRAPPTTLLKAGDVRARGRGPLRRDFRLALYSTGRLEWTRRGSVRGSVRRPRAKVLPGDGRIFVAESGLRSFKFKCATPEAAGAWVEALEESSSLVELERVATPPRSPRAPGYGHAPLLDDGAGEPTLRALPGFAISFLFLSVVYRWFGWAGVSSCVTTGLAVLPRYFRAIATNQALARA